MIGNNYLRSTRLQARCKALRARANTCQGIVGDVGRQDIGCCDRIIGVAGMGRTRCNWRTDGAAGERSKLVVLNLDVLAGVDRQRAVIGDDIGIGDYLPCGSVGSGHGRLGQGNRIVDGKAARSPKSDAASRCIASVAVTPVFRNFVVGHNCLRCAVRVARGQAANGIIARRRRGETGVEVKQAMRLVRRNIEVCCCIARRRTGRCRCKNCPIITGGARNSGPGARSDEK